MMPESTPSTELLKDNPFWPGIPRKRRRATSASPSKLTDGPGDENLGELATQVYCIQSGSRWFYAAAAKRYTFRFLMSSHSASSQSSTSYPSTRPRASYNSYASVAISFLPIRYIRAVCPWSGILVASCLISFNKRVQESPRTVSGAASGARDEPSWTMLQSRVRNGGNTPSVLLPASRGQQASS